MGLNKKWTVWGIVGIGLTSTFVLFQNFSNVSNRFILQAIAVSNQDNFDISSICGNKNYPKVVSLHEQRIQMKVSDSPDVPRPLGCAGVVDADNASELQKVSDFCVNPGNFRAVATDWQPVKQYGKTISWASQFDGLLQPNLIYYIRIMNPRNYDEVHTCVFKTVE